MTNEFTRIATYFAPLATASGTFNLTDDAAVIVPPKGRELVFTKDVMCEGIHFTGAESPDLVAKKLLRVNLSDLAAMGATPLYYMLGIMLPARMDDAWLGAFAGGLAQDQEKYGITLIGGDSSKSASDKASFSLTAIGHVAPGKALRRNGARIGDVVAVTGTIGDSVLGLMAISGKLTGINTVHKAYLEQRYLLPQPRLAIGQALAGVAHSCMDISDSLVQDAGHIAAQSGVKLAIDAARIPLSKAARACMEVRPELLETLLTGGDDYEMLFTLPEKYLTKLPEGVTLIGSVSKGSGVSVKDYSGYEMTFAKTGWQHW